jgi:23S rRNA U2552 (ribose-2'-O)-methylase RlmE/FtsJ
MDPKKNKLWNIMKYITNNYYYLDKFERLKDNKFIENNMELSKIGKEMFDNFKLTNDKIFFIDICGAPGMYSKILVEDKKAQGIGISLPPEKGGVKFEFIHNNYKIYYKDILEKQYKIEVPRDINMGIASCVSYIEETKSSIINIELILTSMNIILEHLENGGDMIINMSMKNIYICFNILDLLLKQFNDVKLWKSDNIWSTKNTFYVFCYGFKKDNKINMLEYVSKVKDSNSDFNNKYLGNNYNIINKLINNIYIIRINAWIKLIKNNDN